MTEMEQLIQTAKCWLSTQCVKSGSEPRLTRLFERALELERERKADYERGATDMRERVVEMLHSECNACGEVMASYLTYGEDGIAHMDYSDPSATYWDGKAKQSYELIAKIASLPTTEGGDDAQK